MAMALENLIFVSGSTTFDIPQFKTLHETVKKDQCIQSEPFKLGGYDWVIQFYPNGTSSLQKTTHHSEIFIEVLKAEKKCSVICTPLRWVWNSSTWDCGKPETMMDLPQSGDTARSGFIYGTNKYINGSKFCKGAGSRFLKNDMIRIKFDILVTPNPNPPSPSPKPTCACLSNYKPAGTNNLNQGS